MAIVVGGAMAACSSSQPQSASGVSGSGAGAGGGKAFVMPTTPITMQMYQKGAGLSDTEFNNLIAGPVNKKYPNVTLQIVRETAEVKAADLVTSGSFPDLIFTSSLGLNYFTDLKLLANLNDLIKKNNLDLNQYEKRSIDEIKRFGAGGEIYAIPFSLNFGALFYNKDIFNKVGLPFPQDGITYEDVLDIAQKVASRDPSVAALSNNPVQRIAVSLRLPNFDPKTNKATLTTEGFAYLLNFFKSANDIPDNKKVKVGQPGFLNDKNSAMLTAYGAVFGQLEELQKSGQAFDWDMTTFPVRKGVSDPGMETETHILSVSATAKNPDAAFEVIKYLSTSEDVQMLVSKAARISPLKDDKYKQVFGADLTTLKGKNVAAIFKNKFGLNALPTQFDDLMKTVIKDASTKYNAGGTDVNSILREAEEQANQQIAAALQGGK
jgi:multiple sugar transport system substrate-binding protein